MKEFLLPDLSQWLLEYQVVPWHINMNDKDELSHPAGVYSHLSPLVRDIFERSPRLDYYEPYRAALLLDTFHLLEPPVLKGAVAYAVWMLKNEFPTTKYMGAELCRSFNELSDWLKLPQEVVNHVHEVLEQRGQEDFPAGSVGIIRQWLEDAEDRRPLATWYEDRALASEHKYPLSP